MPFKLPAIKWPGLKLNQGRNVHVTSPARVTVLTVSLGISFIALLALYFRRKRGPKHRREANGRTEAKEGSEVSRKGLSPNGDVISGRHRRTDSPSESSLRSLLREKSGSVSSLGGVSTSTITQPVVDTSSLSPIQLCHLGFETLQLAIKYWEDGAVKLCTPDDGARPALQDAETAALQHQLDSLIDSAYRMIDSYERQCERQADQVAFDSAIAAFTETDRLSERRSLDAYSSSDQESFVSATDMANLADLDNHREMFHHLPLYEAGLLELKHGSISCRSLRTEMTHCLSDTEFLAKLHCVRLAMDMVFQDEKNREYFSDMGQQLLSNFLIRADRDPEDFYTAYSVMMSYVENSENWHQMEEELRGRGVKSFSFYDVVLDFILMDAFDDLADPPSSVTTVVQNRWLSNGFKETALSTACWSVLKAKRRLLKFSDGFISKFYSISEHTSPVLAWGFLGPESELKDHCNFFKETVLTFIRDMFSFEKARYTTVEELAEDIIRLAKHHIENAVSRLKPET